MADPLTRLAAGLHTKCSWSHTVAWHGLFVANKLYRPFSGFSVENINQINSWMENVFIEHWLFKRAAICAELYAVCLYINVDFTFWMSVMVILLPIKSNVLDGLKVAYAYFFIHFSLAVQNVSRHKFLFILVCILARHDNCKHHICATCKNAVKWEHILCFKSGKKKLLSGGEGGHTRTEIGSSKIPLRWLVNKFLSKFVVFFNKNKLQVQRFCFFSIFFKIYRL